MINREDESSNLMECQCKKCGKTFIPAGLHRYKDSRGKYCSWTCFNHRNDGKKAKYQAVEALYPDGTLYMTFQSATKAAEWFGSRRASFVKEAIKNKTQWNGYFWRNKK